MATTTRKSDVIVIGAGMAGIAAAWSLREAGIESIVLEARPDRIGGRIWSRHTWKDAPVDLGASWVTHMTINPLVDIARANRIALKPSELLNLSLRSATGNQLSDDDIVATMALYFEALGTVKLNAARRAARGLPDIPASEEFDRVLKKMKLQKDVLRNVEFFLNYQIAEPNAANLDDLSLYKWDDDYVQTMLAIAVVPGGYVTIAEALAKNLDIRLGHVVSNIAHDEHGVTVATNHGEFTAPYAVVTLPHGVLAKASPKFFSPGLPAWKRGALKRIHTGLSDKFWFMFPSVFWKPNRDILGRVDAEGKGYWSTWVNYHHYKKQPILLCFNHTEHALALEKMSDDRVVDEAMAVLRAEYGTRIPDPLDMQRSAWHADPFARGSLPHIPPGASSDDYRTLARPVGRVRFAGDSTQAEFNGTVFGAFLSGVREAEQLTCLLYDKALTRARGLFTR